MSTESFCPCKCPLPLEPIGATNMRNLERAPSMAGAISDFSATAVGSWTRLRWSELEVHLIPCHCLATSPVCSSFFRLPPGYRTLRTRHHCPRTQVQCQSFVLLYSLLLLLVSSTIAPRGDGFQQSAAQRAGILAISWNRRPIEPLCSSVSCRLAPLSRPSTMLSGFLATQKSFNRLAANTAPRI